MDNLKPYRPSNGTEGDIFYSQWCKRCYHEIAHRADPDSGGGCMIYLRSMAFDIDHPEYPTEWIEDSFGPGCTAFIWEELTDIPLDPNAVVRPLL